MNTTNKNVNKALESAPKEKSEKSGNLPEKKFRAGAVSATIWLNKGQTNSGEETEYRTITIERSYTDKEGKWQSNNSLRISDLPKATIVLQKAYEHLVLNKQDNFKHE
jgi:hypothetical protein